MKRGEEKKEKERKIGRKKKWGAVKKERKVRIA